MRIVEKIAAVLLIALAAWAVLMALATNFHGSQSNRILLVELGADAASLNLAVAADGSSDKEGIAHNVRMVVRNTYLDFVFILLYWLTFISLSWLAGMLGQRILAVCAVLSISFAALADLLENHAILVAMGVKDFTDPVAVDISECSQAKWAFFFLATVLLGLAIALGRRSSIIRRITGGIFAIGGACGILGLVRYGVELEFAIVMINISLGLITIALLLTLWKLLQSLRELGRNEGAHHVHS